MNIQITRRKNSRSITLRVLPGAIVRVNAPHWIPDFAIQEFLAHQSDWITSKLKQIAHLPKVLTKSQTKKEYQLLKPKALKIASDRAAYFNKYYGFKYKKISIRNQTSRWGSCSHSGTLSFNYRIALLDPILSDYIIVHELCHLGQMNHSHKFWDLVAKTLPNHKTLRKKLRQIHLSGLSSSDTNTKGHPQLS